MTASSTDSAPVESLSHDELQLRAQGHVGELPRQFGLLASLSLAFSLTNSWIGYSAVFVIPLIAGGGPSLFFELASAFPSSGGQYHFAFMVSPLAYRAAISYTVGWLSVFSWWMTSASACLISSQIILTIATFFYPEYSWTQWQVWIVYLVLTIMATTIIIFLPTLLPQIEIFTFGASVLGFVVFTICVLALSGPKTSADIVFVDWNNISGWSDGAAFLLGVGQLMYAFIGIDAATHFAEEMPNPGRGVPYTIGLTMAIGIFTTFVWGISIMFAIQDFDEVTGSSMPILTVLVQILSNRSTATFFSVWLLLLFFGATISCYATSGRLAWAFARDKGLPFSTTFSKVHPTLKVPVNATILTAVFIALFGLIYIGLTTAFSSIIGLSVLGLNASYVIPQIVALVRGREKVLLPRQFSLGPILGPFCNIFSFLWMLMYAVLFCFPLFLPVTEQSMNYLSVVVVGVMLFIALTWWFGKRKEFTGPDVHLEGLEHSATLAAETPAVSVHPELKK